VYLSIVTTLYNSAPYLREFYRRITAAADRITSDYELIFVNDGSPDDSLNVALGLYETDDRMRVVDLSRNFGHHKAIMTGLSHTRGDLIFLIDSDLEEEPELLEKFHEHLKASAADVVFGVQRQRKGKLFERITGTIFFRLFNLLSAHPVPVNVVTARLMTRRFVSALITHREREVVISGLWAMTGFKQIPLTIRKHHRSATSYSLSQRVSHFVNAITSFSSKPLVFIFYLGCVIFGVSCIAAADLLVRKVFFGTMLAGWPSLIISIWLMGGLIIFCLGVVGIYLSKVFIEVKRRPYTVIRNIYEREKVPLTIDDRLPEGDHIREAELKLGELR
jgi:putative glycosyltransferase